MVPIHHRILSRCSAHSRDRDRAATPQTEIYNDVRKPEPNA